MNDVSGANDSEALLTYYRNRASNLEFEFLQFQLAAQKEIEELRATVASLRAADDAEAAE